MYSRYSLTLFSQSVTISFFLVLFQKYIFTRVERSVASARVWLCTSNWQSLKPWSILSLCRRDSGVSIWWLRTGYLFNYDSLAGLYHWTTGFLVWEGFLGQPLGRISRLPQEPWMLYALIALQQHSPFPRRFYPTENWLSSRCLTSVSFQNRYFQLDISHWHWSTKLARLLNGSTPHSSEGIIQLKTDWAQDAWLQWLAGSWYFHLDICHWQKNCISLASHVVGVAVWHRAMRHSYSTWFPSKYWWGITSWSYPGNFLAKSITHTKKCGHNCSSIRKIASCSCTLSRVNLELLRHLSNWHATRPSLSLF